MLSPPYAFISYRRGELGTRVADRFYDKLVSKFEYYGGGVFFDQKCIKPGQIWSDEISSALERTTHFIALLSDEYWVDSKECRKELAAAIGKWENDSTSMKVLCVQVRTIDPRYLNRPGF